MSETATLALHAGRVRLEARVAMTPAGLVATGTLVAAILLATATLVGVATRGRRTQEGPSLPRSDGPPVLDTLREEA